MYQGKLVLKGPGAKIGPLTTQAASKRELFAEFKKELPTVFCADDAVELIFLLNSVKLDWLTYGKAYLGAVGGFEAWLYLEHPENGADNTK